MLVAIAPAAVGLAFCAWIVMFLASRYVSLASVIAAAVLAALVWIPRFCAYRPTSAAMTLLAAVVIVRHRSNIGRLFRGTESRFSFTAAQKAREDARRAARKEAP